MIRPDTLVFRTLASMARQRRELGAVPCDVVAGLLQASIMVQRTLQCQVERAGLTDLKFAVLVTLYALDPNPVSTADLAFYTGFTRAAVTKGAAGLSAQALVAAKRDATDRRVMYYRLRSSGRRLGEKTALEYLRVIGLMARGLKPPAVAALQRACAILAGGALRLSSTLQPSSP